ncbi:MAG: hypothetical protein GYA23_01945 [Methanomicrobiales archaeon]|nr:hypothetical protein [Methanomicrobiales archaeon]
MPYQSRTLLPFCLLTLCLLALIIAGGCTTPASSSSPAASPLPAESQNGSSYQIAIAQPDALSGFIHMDTDVYNTGEVVEFVITNTGSQPLECSNTPPDFRVTFQAGSGRWATQMGPEHKVVGNSSRLQTNESTRVYRFVTEGWAPGRYRIVSDCGAERDFLVRALPVPVATPTPCPLINESTTVSWIHINPVGNQVAARPFTIAGTTNIGEGDELRYSIFPVNEADARRPDGPHGTFVTIVQGGTCGTNTWSATGEIQAVGDFFVAVTDSSRNTTAVQRFTVTL